MEDGATELEKELEEHTKELRESLLAMNEALAVDSGDEQRLLVEQLSDSIKAAEQSLFELKRARLLREVDAMAQAAELPASSPVPNESPVGVQIASSDADEEEPEEPSVSFPVESKCRFRYTNGRWYNGKVIMVDESGVARVSFLSPTTENLQVCRFFLQQRCRYGGNCRQSHGLQFPLHALQPFVPVQWQNIPIGSTIFACDSIGGVGLWRPAELESFREFDQRARVVFVDDGQKAELNCEQLALSEYAESTDTSESSSSEEEDEEDFDTAADHGVGVLLADQNGVSVGKQTDTVTFAEWEKHTRGVASKMMVSMGFRQGMGLGKDGQGQLAPIQVKLLPPKQSLGYVDAKSSSVKVSENGTKVQVVTKKKSRGGQRKRQKKWAAAAFAAKVAKDRQPDMFGFINQQLAGQSNKEATVTPSVRESNRDEPVRKREFTKKRPQKEDRRSIVAQEVEMAEIRSKISRLEEMATRNYKEKAVVDGVGRKLKEARKALLAAEAAHASSTNAVNSKEKEKKWLRF